jgi:hypothetical protein
MASTDSIMASMRRPGLLACYLSDLVLQRVKSRMHSMNRRFKVVVQVTIGQKRGQGTVR